MTDKSSDHSDQSFQGSLARPRWFYRQWMLAGNPAHFFERLVQDHGDFIQYRGLLNFYQVNHPTLVKAVLMGTHKTFDKQTSIYRRFANFAGDGLVVSEGEKWKRQRKLMQPMFGPKTVRRFFGSMLGAAEKMAERWKARYSDKKVFDIAEEMDSLTLQIAGLALFSDGFEDDASQIRRWTTSINHYSAKPPLPIIRQFWFPSSVNRKIKRTLCEFKEFMQDLIDGRRRSGHQDDLLSILLESKHEDSGQPMSDSEIAEEVLGMIVGGHETSSTALSWLWWELHQDPGVEAKLHKELDEVIGDDPLSMDHLPQLKYARMVLDECLRMHPPFWFENRNARKDVELGGVTIRKGSLVLFSRYSLHRHPDFWKDPDKFIPERHDPENPENTRATYAFVPFGGGPRICIGINFAIMELLIIVATIARQFRVLVSDQDRHQMMAKMTMAPKFGVRVFLQRR